MVKQHDKDGYRCPYCEKFFESVRDAWACASECADVESPEDATESHFECEMCGQKFAAEPKAGACEAHHEDASDHHYQEWLILESRRRLEEAGNHPAQVKLFEESHLLPYLIFLNKEPLI